MCIYFHTFATQIEALLRLAITTEGIQVGDYGSRTMMAFVDPLDVDLVETMAAKLRSIANSIKRVARIASDHESRQKRVVVSGFPAIAAFQAKYPNTRTCRSFTYATQRLLVECEGKLTCLVGALADLDAKTATKSNTGGGGSGQPVPFNREDFIRRCLNSPDQLSLVQVPVEGERSKESDSQKRARTEAERENLMANFERILEHYRNHVNWQYGLNKFPRASPKTHARMFKHLKDTMGLQPDALDYLRAGDDFMYPDADPTHERFYFFLIDVRTAFIAIFKFLGCGRLLKNGSIPFLTGVWREKRVRLLVISLLALFAVALLLGPVGILYLVEPRKEIAFLIMVLSDIAFAFILLALEIRLHHAFLGLAACTAVLVAVLL
ncbi:hypothetical protein NPX13_g4395 [Xylaria arbuscula]|uniref:DUF6594 domain-containing protein n=1 Tax=Xylaria arbuscula TaxID=114810 RepID=A0A9W8TM95_9PEZI|nr:hypothetical protein NPX13_g4395 [Xylaria arbuscula]